MATCKSLVQAQSSIQCICVLLNCCSIVTCIRGEILTFMCKIYLYLQLPTTNSLYCFFATQGVPVFKSFSSTAGIQLHTIQLKRGTKGPLFWGPTWYQGWPIIFLDGGGENVVQSNNFIPSWSCANNFFSGSLCCNQLFPYQSTIPDGQTKLRLRIEGHNYM